MNWLRAMLPRDLRAFIALMASIGGAVVLTGFSVWLVKLMVTFARGDPAVRMEVIRALATSNYGLLAIIGAILLSLGLAINRRQLRGKALGVEFEASGGDEPSPETTAAAAAGAAAGAIAGTSAVSAIAAAGPIEEPRP